MSALLLSKNKSKSHTGVVAGLNVSGDHRRVTATATAYRLMDQGNQEPKHSGVFLEWLALSMSRRWPKSGDTHVGGEDFDQRESKSEASA